MMIVVAGHHQRSAVHTIIVIAAWIKALEASAGRALTAPVIGRPPKRAPQSAGVAALF
jgi:hypothetical protein